MGLSSEAVLAEVRLLVTAAGIPQSELARLSGVSQSVISRIATGRSKRVNSATLKKLGDAIEHDFLEADGDRLLRSSLDWALRHIKKQRDTDLLPRPFEFRSLEQAWPSVRVALAAIDLSEYVPSEPRHFLVPKQANGLALRRITQLDPIDALLYAAIVYEARELIEEARAPRNVACSWRLNTPLEELGFVSRDEAVLFTSGRDEFESATRKLALQGENALVLEADISDFYNQISHEVLRRSLEDVGVSPDRAANLTRILRGISGGRDRGIPVGPHPSALLAECMLIGVDRFLTRKGARFTRFNDDFRIFCSSEQEARLWLHALAHHLTLSYGLSLNEKTELRASSNLLVEASIDYGDRPDPRRAKRGRNLGPHKRSFERMAQDEFRELSVLTPLPRIRAERLFNSAPGGSLDKLLLAKGENWSRYAPVLGEFVRYLMRSPRGKSPKNIGRRLIKLGSDSELSHLPFVKLWVAQAITTVFADELEQEADEFCGFVESAGEAGLGLRPTAQLAANRGYREWVRSYSKRWSSRSTWERRALLHAAKSLSLGERTEWEEEALRVGLVEATLARSYLSGQEPQESEFED